MRVCVRAVLGSCPASNVPLRPAIVPSQALQHEAAVIVKQHPGRAEIWGEKWVFTKRCLSCWALLRGHALKRRAAGLEGCLLSLVRRSSYSGYTVHPQYAEHRTTCMLITILFCRTPSSMRVAFMSLPMPCCYLLFCAYQIPQLPPRKPPSEKPYISIILGYLPWIFL